MKIFIHGKDNMGWALDIQRMYLMKSLVNLGHKVVSNPITADLILSVYWYPLRKFKFRVLKFKKVVALATNFVNLDDKSYELMKEFEKANKIVSAWIAPSKKQLAIFNRHGIKAYYQPFYVDDNFFNLPNYTKLEICNFLNLDYNQIKGKVVLGSFQRDSIGSSLITPKWQKGPDILVKLLKNIKDTSKYILLLNGPRRHYIISECKKYNIPYLYTGREPMPNEDDIISNMLPIDKMPLLYLLTDIYLVTSRSEGGPKSILESCLTKTLILSTDVGLAKDFIPENFIFSNIERYIDKLTNIIENYNEYKYRSVLERNYKNAFNLLNMKSMDKSLQLILMKVNLHNKI